MSYRKINREDENMGQFVRRYNEQEKEAHFIVERWICGEFLGDYIRKLERTDGVGDVIKIINQDIDEEYEGWNSVKKLIKELSLNNELIVDNHYIVIFDFFGKEKDLRKLDDSPMDYFGYDVQ